MKIKKKLFIFFMICIVAFAVVSILLNALFLEKFYLKRNESIFQDAGERIAKQYNEGSGDILEFIRRVDRAEGINCMIAGPDYRIKYSSFPAKGPILAKEIVDLFLDNSQVNGDSYAYAIVDTPEYGIRDIAYVMGLQGGDVLVLRRPLQSITQSTEIANQFLLYTGLLILVVGGAAIYFFACRITRPIVAMTGVARSISDLDFSNRVDINSRDEMGELGKSINRMADKLIANLETLKQDVERRKQLVRNLSHELKTPVGVIKGYAEGLKFGVVEDAHQAGKYCDVIVDECDRMDDMISELLELSRLESGVFNPEITDIQVGEMLDTIRERFSPAAVKKGVALLVECTQGLVVKGDRSLLERAVGNYLSNAIKHADGEKHAVISAVDSEDFVRFSVFNTGAPIPDKDREKLWDVFYMADKARTRESSHGLGLSIVKSIAELHGARYGIKNRDDGVEFYIDFYK